MPTFKIGVLEQNADLQLRAAFVRKFDIHLTRPEFSADCKQAHYSRNDGRKFTPDQVDFINTFLDGWRSCAFTFDRLLKCKDNWADNPLEGC